LLEGAYLNRLAFGDYRTTQLRISLSDRDGHVLFDRKDFYNDGEIIIQTDGEVDSLYNLEILNPFSNGFSKNRIPHFSFISLHSSQLRPRNKALKIQNAYNLESQGSFLKPTLDSSAFYSKPDIMYKLDDYVRFPKMEDILREYLSQVMVRKRNDKFYLAIYSEGSNESYSTEPLILLDGLPIFDTDRIMNYSPLKVERLEILTRQYQLGDLVFNGVLNFITYNVELNGFNLYPHTTVIDYEGLQK